MKWSSSRAADVVLLASLLLTPVPTAAQLDCTKILADKTKFDFGKLAGPHSVVTTAVTPPTITNTTYTVDLCASLKRKGNVGKEDRCPGSTRLCAITREKYDDKDEPNERPSKVIPIVGGLSDHGGKEIDPIFTRLKTSRSNADARKEGVRLELHGGTYGGVKQMAIIEMLCMDDFQGNEGEVPGDFEYTSIESPQPRSMMNIRSMRAADDEEPTGGAEEQIKGSDEPALLWESYRMENDYQTLRLTWHTKYACEASADSGGVSSHWGFFTWFVVLVFLGTAAYLIFGSWLNYNRYGARGWDLLPHGDTIRDIPFLLKDWMRRLINTLQGSGSRGGYSAV